MGNEALGENVS